MSSPDPLTRGEKNKLTRLRGFLLSWYAEHGRDLPWRRDDASTFEKICVEVLLQRTQATAVARVYPNFFARFRNWDDLAEASIEELEDQFKPIGLWQRRAKSMKGLATYAAEVNGLFHSNRNDLEKIPGVGQYVANAILLFQHQKPMPLLDVNMARVIETKVRPRRLA